MSSHMPDLLSELAVLLEVEPASLTFLRHSQNRVYELTGSQGESCILRLTADSHRTREEVQSKLDWLLHLYVAGLSVCPPLGWGQSSDTGEMIRSVTLSSGLHHAVMFQKAAGHAVTAADLSPALYEAHGRHLGRLHALSREGPPSLLKGRRPWHQERYFTSDIAPYLPAVVQEPLRAHFQRLRQAVERLPQYSEHWGPVHFDLGYANFFVSSEGTGLELFDFDNCTRSYYVGDIAAALYGSVFTALRCEFPGDRSCFEPPKSSRILEQIWGPFKKGYESQSPWPEVWNAFLEPWFHLLYFRAVVHAFRLRHPITDPQIKAALDADLKCILKDDLPLRFDFVNGVAVG